MKNSTIQALFGVALLGSAATAGDHPFETDTTREPAFQTGGDALITDVTVHSAVAPAFVADVLVVDGDIVAIGDNLGAPEGVLSIDGTGKHLAPGVIDPHSHMAIERGINESTLSITADCDITDVINVDDVGLYRALAGGVTTIQCLHGSANTIGGRSEVLKLRWHAETAEELRFEGAPQGIKFALGENVKRSRGSTPQTRFPASRMGVEAVFYRAFERAREYQAEWRAYGDAQARGEDPAPPRRDLRLEVLADILEGDVTVHSHCYRADEILMLLRTAEHFGFQIGTLQHVLEGYKIAAEIAAHGAGPSTFADWWAYKVEAYDAIPQNAALMDEAGAVTTINSDSGELVRHLYHEAAKSVHYADMDPVAALRLCTLNAAIQLGIDEHVGSIEVGKDADLVLLDADPFSCYSKVLWTMVDGEIEFTRIDSFGFDAEPLEARPLAESELVEAAAPSVAAGELTFYVGATLHPVTSPEIENGVLVTGAGRILAMGGTETPIPEGANVVDLSGLHVYPGMIALNTPIGITEIGSVRATNDSREIGGNQPDLRVSASIHPESSIIGVTRVDGITRAQTAPQGGGPLMGQSAVIQLEGLTWEELLTVDRDMLHLAFPRISNSSDDEDEPESLQTVRSLFEDALDYARRVEEAQAAGAAPPRYDRRLAELAPYAAGERRIALHASNAQSILFAIRFAQETGIDAALFGCTEGWKVADAIADSGIPVVVGPILTVPRSEYDPYDAGYANAAVLYRAGCDVAIMSDAGENTRNLPFHAAFAAAYGLPREEALRAVTYRAAEVLGVEADFGSLAPGKVADLVVTDGDLLEVTTHVMGMVIGGEPASMENRQTRLYERYHERLHEIQGR